MLLWQPKLICAPKWVHAHTFFLWGTAKILRPITSASVVTPISLILGICSLNTLRYNLVAIAIKYFRS